MVLEDQLDDDQLTVKVAVWVATFPNQSVDLYVAVCCPWTRRIDHLYDTWQSDEMLSQRTDPTATPSRERSSFLTA